MSQTPVEIQEEDFTMENLIGTLRKEIPRIINNTEMKTIIDNRDEDPVGDKCDINEVVNVIESLEKGEKPILLKIVSGDATPDEIAEWSKSNDIPTEDIDQVLSMLISSFAAGTEIAERIEADMTEQSENINTILSSINSNELTNFDKEKVLKQLDSILARLDTIRQEVTGLIYTLKPLTFISNE